MKTRHELNERKYPNYQSDPEARVSLPKQLREAAMHETDTRKAQGMRDIADEFSSAMAGARDDQSLDRLTTLTALAARGWHLYINRSPIGDNTPGGSLPVEQERRAA